MHQQRPVLRPDLHCFAGHQLQPLRLLRDSRGHSDACGQSNCASGETAVLDRLHERQQPDPGRGLRHHGHAGDGHGGALLVVERRRLRRAASVQRRLRRGLTCAPAPTAPFATAVRAPGAAASRVRPPRSRYRAHFTRGPWTRAAASLRRLREGSGVTCSGAALVLFGLGLPGLRRQHHLGVCSETTPAFQSWKLTNVTFTGTPSSTAERDRPRRRRLLHPLTRSGKIYTWKREFVEKAARAFRSGSPRRGTTTRSTSAQSAVASAAWKRKFVVITTQVPSAPLDASSPARAGRAPTSTSLIELYPATVRYPLAIAPTPR